VGGRLEKCPLFGQAPARIIPASAGSQTKRNAKGRPDWGGPFLLVQAKAAEGAEGIYGLTDRSLANRYGFFG
jgi:hypothetical protein